jgi:hypothetical protein
MNPIFHSTERIGAGNPASFNGFLRLASGVTATGWNLPTEDGCDILRESAV